MFEFKTGDPCPLCGQPIQLTDPEDLLLLSVCFHLLGARKVNLAQRTIEKVEVDLE